MVLLKWTRQRVFLHETAALEVTEVHKLGGDATVGEDSAARLGDFQALVGLSTTLVCAVLLCTLVKACLG